MFPRFCGIFAFPSHPTSRSGRMAWFGPKQSIQQLVQDHYEALYRFAYRLCGSGPEAEDLKQETFCQAHRRLAQLRDAARAKAWLLRILRNADQKSVVAGERGCKRAS